jgi:hypothetical protein
VLIVRDSHCFDDIAGVLLRVLLAEASDRSL